MKQDRKDDVLILHFKGRLDALSTPELEVQVLSLIDKGEYHLLFDFEGVDYISSAGMRMLLAVTKRLKEVAGLLIVCRINTNVMDVFKMSGFDHVLELTQSEEDALRKFSKEKKSKV